MSERKVSGEMERNHAEFDETRDQNWNPITSAPDSQPVGPAMGGTATAALVGAAIGGVVGGPVGAVVGGAIGAVAGLSAKAVVIDPILEEAYWKANYKTRPYYTAGNEYNDFGTSYRFGWETAGKPEYAGRKFEEIESALKSSWPSYSGNDDKSWKDSRDSTRDAYNRIRDRE